MSAGFDWFPDWRGQTAIIVASGPSARDVPLSMARDRARFIVVNECHRLAPWADVLYAADAQWWERNRGLRGFKGLRVSQSDAARRAYGVRQVNLHRVNRLIRKPVGTIGYGGNSGFQAINLAVQFGARSLILVGFDMRVDLGVHWHGPHERMNNPNDDSVNRWGRIIDRLSRQFDAMGIEVVNSSPVSTLTAYRKVDFSEAMAPRLAA